MLGAGDGGQVSVALLGCLSIAVLAHVEGAEGDCSVSGKLRNGCLLCHAFEG